MTGKISAGILLVSFLCFSFVLSAQSRKDLERKRREKEKEIQLTKKLLTETKSKKKQSLNQLQIISRQIKVREEIIEDINTEVTKVNEEISTRNNDITKLNKEIKALKDEYAELIYFSYKSKHKTDFFSFLFSSASVNQAVKRVQYLRQIADHREIQLAQIVSAQENLKVKVAELSNVKEEKSKLLGEQKAEKRSLEEDKTESKKLVTQLQQKESELKKELEQKKKSLRELEGQIRKIIQAEINRNKPAAAKGSTGKSTVNSVTLTPEGKKLSSEFSGNKGNLPWPVEKGFVSRHFGKNAHPDLKGITIENNGVDIVTTNGAAVRTVFSGEVRAIFSIPGMQKAVMISHGDFFTVYAHLDQVLVSKGDKLSNRQQIGLVHTDADEGKAELHFEIWQNSNKQNPENWLAGR